MVVTDLDDTLLSREKEISEAAVEVIEGLAQKGVRFTFITGRPPYAVERFAQRVHITAPIVACNGAMLMNPENGEISAEKSLDISLWKDILEKAREQGHTILVLSGETEYALSETDWTRKRREAGREVPVAELEMLLSRDNIYKMNIMEEKGAEPFELLIPQIRGLEEQYSVSLYGTSGCEIVAKDVDKEAGMRALCEICGIQPEEVLAVGDNENDLRMILAAGIGAAVGNAVDRVKEAADYICEKTYTDGVIEAVLRFV